jgi:hypothetical protein
MLSFIRRVTGPQATLEPSARVEPSYARSSAPHLIYVMADAITEMDLGRQGATAR